MSYKVLVLGHRGMLGHMVYKYLVDSGFDVTVCDYRFPTDEFKQFVKSYEGDYIINCIGAIPQRTSEFDVNRDLPIWLCCNTTVKVIHAGTDCEIDTNEYGFSKSDAANFIKKYSSNTKIIKTSIIGPELNSNASLMEWFLSQDGEVQGYTGAMWNGNTTLEWVKQCVALITNWMSYDIETIIESEPVSKFELLHILKDIFDKDIVINAVNAGKNKCLVGTIQTKSIREQLKELKEYYYNVAV